MASRHYLFLFFFSSIYEQIRGEKRIMLDGVFKKLWVHPPSFLILSCFITLPCSRACDAVDIITWPELSSCSFAWRLRVGGGVGQVTSGFQASCSLKAHCRCPISHHRHNGPEKQPRFFFLNCSTLLSSNRICVREEYDGSLIKFPNKSFHSLSPSHHTLSLLASGGREKLPFFYPSLVISKSNKERLIFILRMCRILIQRTRVVHAKKRNLSCPLSGVGWGREKDRVPLIGFIG